MLRRAVDSREDAFPGVGPLGDDDVADYPRFEFSMKDVKRAGKVISGSMPWTDETKDEIIRAFQIANNWRDSHAYPVKSVRSQVIYYLRELGIDGSTFARLKRMQARHRSSGASHPA